MNTHTHQTSTTNSTKPNLNTLNTALLKIQTTIQHPQYQQHLLTNLNQQTNINTIQILHIIKNTKKHPLNIKNITNTLTINPSTTNQIINQYINNKLLTHQPYSHNRHHTKLILTTPTHQILKATNTIHHKILTKITKK